MNERKNEKTNERKNERHDNKVQAVSSGSSTGRKE
jgi:hypothetical protein